jgi:hypothetical protein
MRYFNGPDMTAGLVGVSPVEKSADVQVAKRVSRADDEFPLLEESNMIVDRKFVYERVYYPYFFQNLIVLCTSQINHIDILIIFLLHLSAQHVNEVSLEYIPCVDGVDIIIFRQ